jgi:hypothetical protein
MGGKDYIPDGQAERDEWASNFAEQVTLHYLDYGLTVTEKTAIVTVNMQRKSFYTEKQQAEAVYRGKVESWKAKDAEFVEVARKYIRKVQARPETTDAQREELRITVSDVVPTPVGAPTDEPMIRIDFSHREEHIIHVGPNPENELRNAKPKGVASIELRMKADTPPSGADDTVPVAIITHSPYTAKLPAHKGKTVWWIARYLNTKGETGPWSEMVSAEVTGL